MLAVFNKAVALGEAGRESRVGPKDPYSEKQEHIWVYVAALRYEREEYARAQRAGEIDKEGLDRKRSDRYGKLRHEESEHGSYRSSQSYNKTVHH